MPAQFPLRLIQMGREATAGTIVPATMKMIGTGIYNPHIDRYFADLPRGWRAAVTDGGRDRMRGSTLDFTKELTFEEVLWPLNTGVATCTVTGALRAATAGAPASTTVTGVNGSGTTSLVVGSSVGLVTTGMQVLIVDGVSTEVVRVTGAGDGTHIACTATVYSHSGGQTVTLGGTSTSGTNAAGATVVNVVASTNLQAADIVQIDTGTLAESHKVLSVGAGTVTLAAGESLLFAHAANVPVVCITTAGQFTHIALPNLAGNPNVQTVTSEFAIADGTTNFYTKNFAYGMTSQFTVDWQFNKEVLMTWKMFGRAENTLGAPTAALAVLTGREPAMGNLSTLSIDTTWAGLGGTAYSQGIRSAKLDVTTGLAPDWTLDGRAGIDMTTFVWGIVKAKLILVIEHNANAQTQIGQWRTVNPSPLQFIRLKSTGPVTAAKSFQLDFCGAFSVDPKFSEQAKTELVTLEYESEYDPVSSKMLQFTVVNNQYAFI